MKTKRIDFDIDLAKKIQAGEAQGRIVTRDGRKARIICFDKKGDYPIVALVNDYNEEEYIKNYDKFGKKFIDGETTDDLMMLPEKKEGWAVIRRSDIYENEGQAKEAMLNSHIAVMIKKITWEE